MARGGIYKTEVKKARDSLLAQGLNPSIDAIRVALGNTGSRSTIHRHMKELEAEEGNLEGAEPISDALKHLVEQLSERLRVEAEERITKAQAACDAAVAQSQSALAEQAKEGRGLSDQLQRTETKLRDERETHAATQEVLQQERTQVAALQERIAGFEARLQEREAHVASLETKHQQAREALEHFRLSSREQRDAELQRHEHQVQSMQVELRQAQDLITAKNQDVLQLNRENARLSEQYGERDKALRELQRQYDQATIIAKEVPALKREADHVTRLWTKTNTELDQLRDEWQRREASWEAERAAWQEEREGRASQNDRLQAIEKLLASFKPALTSISSAATPPASSSRI
jgi:chromosome segregation ATPase